MSDLAVHDGAIWLFTMGEIRTYKENKEDETLEPPVLTNKTEFPKEG
jgi:hypothetical protein